MYPADNVHDWQQWYDSCYFKFQIPDINLIKKSNLQQSKYMRHYDTDSKISTILKRIIIKHLSSTSNWLTTESRIIFNAIISC